MDARQWNPSDPVLWQRVFGFVAQPLIPTATDVTVLRDGTSATFALMQSEPRAKVSQDTMSQVWSADVRHLVCTDNQIMTIWRWDSPGRGEVAPAPRNVSDGQVLLNQLAMTGRSRVPDVLQHVLQAFRQIRLRVHDPAQAVLLLHRVLLSIAKRQQTDVSGRTLLGEMANSCNHNLLSGSAAHITTFDFSDIELYLTQRTSLNLRLHADVLLSHVSSKLFQEAHLDLERQGFFLGMAPEPSGKPASSEIRYTPVNLARLLVQRALDAHGASDALTICDPACGSGVFLLEAANEIIQRRQVATLSLAGIDTSIPAAVIAESCLTHIAGNANGVSVAATVQCADALETEWSDPDIIVMNPPFRSWEDMDDSDRQRVVRAAGHRSRPDKALAFLHRAWTSLKSGGVLASVVPAALLASESMKGLRNLWRSCGQVVLLGRLEGYTYFTNAVVETAFVVVRKQTPTAASRTQIAIGNRNQEDAAIRQVRLNESERSTEAAEVYTIAQDVLQDIGWLPRPRRFVELLNWARSISLPRVSDIFQVRQGVRTGLKTAFMLTESEFDALPKPERRFFRPAAGQGSIEAGVLSRRVFVFYPYDRGGAILETESTLRSEMPRYYDRYLKPNLAALRRRKKIKSWWLPTWPRVWQHEHERKIVSTYFGGRGSFALDRQGEFVVVDGFAWLIKGQTNPSISDLVLYLPILNSVLFEELVSAVSWRLQGGQLRLEPRYVNRIPVPSAAMLPNALRAECRELGMIIMEAGMDGISDAVERLAQRCYGMPERLS